jgi:hypothetical protein
MATSFLLSCQPDGPKKVELNKADLIGRWDISKAWRNGKETETLTGTYYEFDGAGNMKTNLTPTTMEETYQYTFAGNEIKQKGEPPINYTIDSLSSNFLRLSMEIHNFPFIIELAKEQSPTNLEANDTSSADTLKEL